jgi:hypothetical protein
MFSVRRDYDICITAGNRLGSKLHCFEPAAANLANGYCRYGVRKPRPDHCLSGRILATTRREHLPEYDLRNLLRSDAGLF